MADSYLIDGYNLIHALGMIQREPVAGALEQARQRLLEFLAHAFDAQTMVTIVFDARHCPPHAPHRQIHQGLHIEFARDADDRIEERIEQSACPAELVVISNDMRLQEAARRKGGRGWSHEELLDFLDRRSARPATPADSPPRQSGPLSAEEMKRWMAEFGHLQNDPELKEFFDLDRFE